MTHDFNNLSIKESPEGDWNEMINHTLRETETFQLKNPRKGTETTRDKLRQAKKWILSIKESPEGDWNFNSGDVSVWANNDFQLKNPRKGTETLQAGTVELDVKLSIKESPEGDWNKYLLGFFKVSTKLSIKESPEGDWNELGKPWRCGLMIYFQLKNPRKGTETFCVKLHLFPMALLSIKESPEGDWNW